MISATESAPRDAGGRQQFLVYWWGAHVHVCSALHVLRVALSESPQAVADRSNGKSSCPQKGECYFTVGQADLFSPCTMRWLALFAGILRGACANHGEKVTGTGAWKIPAGFRYNLDS